MFEILAEEDRRKRRTLADALEVLRTDANFQEGDAAEIRLGTLKLPSSEIVYLVYVSFRSTIHQKTFLVSLPTAGGVRARFLDDPKLQELEIERLNGAIANGRGDVWLSDGAQIRSVEVIPALLPYEITPLDWTIIRQTMAELGIEEHCRYDPGLQAARTYLGDWLSNSIDCSKLADRPTPLLKSIQARVQDHPEFGSISLQKISDTLHKFGMRKPASRRKSARAEN
jgi:hypothetical protein